MRNELKQTLLAYQVHIFNNLYMCTRVPVDRSCILYICTVHGLGSSDRQNNMYFVISASVLRISYVCVKEYEKFLIRANFFLLKIGQCGCQNIPNLRLISDLKEHFRKNALKKR